MSFFDLADNSGLCRDPVERTSFDFSGGRILAGIWSRGAGCTARHDIQQSLRDLDAGRVLFDLVLVVEGECPYELVRPFWVAVTGADGFEVRFDMSLPEG